MILQRNLFFCFFSLALAGIVISCEYALPAEDASIIIQGEVTITRNNDPFNKYEVSYRDISIYAYLSPPDISYGYHSSYYIASSEYRITFLGDGKYHWVMEIPYYQLPNILYFEVRTLFDDITARSISNSKITEGFLMDKANTLIDLGTINFDMVHITGNLPITVDSEPVNSANSNRIELIMKVQEQIYQMQRYQMSARIDDNGDWSFDIIHSGGEFFIDLEIYIIYNGMSFRKVMETGMPIILPCTEKEIFFPAVNFETFALSGKISPLIPEKDHIGGSIKVYDEEFSLLGAWVSPLNVTELCYLPESDWATWEELKVPAFLFPQKLQFLIIIQTERGNYQGYTNIDVKDAADLQNLDLGVISIWHEFPRENIPS